MVWILTEQSACNGEIIIGVFSTFETAKHQAMFQVDPITNKVDFCPINKKRYIQEYNMDELADQSGNSPFYSWNQLLRQWEYNN